MLKQGEEKKEGSLRSGKGIFKKKKKGKGKFLGKGKGKFLEKGKGREKGIF